MAENSVEDWAVNIKGSKEIVGHPDRGQMRLFLESCGANFGGAEKVRLSLSKWTNQGNYEAMKTIWGEKKWSGFQKWARNYVLQYEATTYTHQGRVGGMVGSGEIRALCLMTRYAAFDDGSDGMFTDQRFALELGIRSKNGELRERGVPIESFRTMVRPDTGEVYRPGSFPPGYIDALVYELKNSSK